jgi:hypothetical protein
MHQRILRLLALMILGLGLSPLLYSNVARAGDDEVLPWPWDTECPFPWETIDGNWVVMSASDREGVQQSVGINQDRFEIHIEYTSYDGTRYFQIRRYDQYGRLRATGRGYSPKAAKIIRAAMFALDDQGRSNPGETCWAIVRAYQSDVNLDCDDDLTTVITVRPISQNAATTSDVHYVVSKTSTQGSQNNHK